MGHIWAKKSDLGHFSLQCELSLGQITVKDKCNGITGTQSHPVHDGVLVTESHSFQQHQHVTFDLGCGERTLGIPNDFRQI